MLDNKSFTKSLGVAVVMYMQTQGEEGIDDMITKLLNYYTIEEIINKGGIRKFIPNIQIQRNGYEHTSCP